MAELAMVYITTDLQDNGAELRCTDHPDWWADADGTDLPSAIRRATDHFRDEHRVHVDGCMCRGAQVIDQRCIPTARCPEPSLRTTGSSATSGGGQDA